MCVAADPPCQYAVDKKVDSSQRSILGAPSVVATTMRGCTLQNIQGALGDTAKSAGKDLRDGAAVSVE